MMTSGQLRAARALLGIDQKAPDAIAGLTVAIVALPLSMAIAIASGATPDRGCSPRSSAAS
jgi:SulP family sulfate permease